MQITKDVGEVVNRIINCQGVSKSFDPSLARGLNPVKRVDYVIGLAEEEIATGQASKGLKSHYTNLMELVPSYFEIKQNGGKPTTEGWDQCPKPTYWKI